MREVSSQDWKDFCHRINGERQGAKISIELVWPDGLKTEKARDLTLEGMVLDTNDSCIDVISVRARNGREIIHNIIDPIHIRLRETESRTDFNLIQIEAENGITYLTLHPAIHAEMLQGLRIS